MPPRLTLDLKIPAGLAGGLAAGPLDVASALSQKENLILSWGAKGTSDGALASPKLDADGFIKGSVNADSAGISLIRSISMTLLDNSLVQGGLEPLKAGHYPLGRFCDALNDCAAEGKTAKARPENGWAANGAVANIQTVAGADGPYTPAMNVGLHPALAWHNNAVVASPPNAQLDLTNSAHKTIVENARKQLIGLTAEVAKKATPEVAKMMHQVLVAAAAQRVAEAKRVLMEKIEERLRGNQGEAQLLQDFAEVTTAERRDYEAAKRQLIERGRVEIVDVPPKERLEIRLNLGFGNPPVKPGQSGSRADDLGNPAIEDAPASGYFVAGQGGAELEPFRQAVLEAERDELKTLQDLNVRLDAAASEMEDTGLQGKIFAAVDADKSAAVTAAQQSVENYDSKLLKFKGEKDAAGNLKTWEITVEKNNPDAISFALKQAAIMSPDGITLFGKNANIRRAIIQAAISALENGTYIPLIVKQGYKGEIELNNRLIGLQRDFGQSVKKVAEYEKAVGAVSAARQDADAVEKDKRKASVDYFVKVPGAVRPVVEARCRALMDILKFDVTTINDIANTAANSQERRAFAATLREVGVVVDVNYNVSNVDPAAGAPPHLSTVEMYTKRYYEAVSKAGEAVGVVMSDARTANAGMRVVFEAIANMLRVLPPESAAAADESGIRPARLSEQEEKVKIAVLQSSYVARQAANAEKAAAAAGTAGLPKTAATEALAAILAMRAVLSTRMGAVGDHSKVMTALNGAETAAREAMANPNNNKLFKTLQEKFRVLETQCKTVGILAPGAPGAWSAGEKADSQELKALVSLGAKVDTMLDHAVKRALEATDLKNVSGWLNTLSAKMNEVVSTATAALPPLSADGHKPLLAALEEAGKIAITVQFVEKVDSHLNSRREAAPEIIKGAREHINVGKTLGVISFEAERKLKDVSVKSPSEIGANPAAPTPT